MGPEPIETKEYLAKVAVFESMPDYKDLCAKISWHLGWKNNWKQAYWCAFKYKNEYYRCGIIEWAYFTEGYKYDWSFCHYDEKRTYDYSQENYVKSRKLETVKGKALKHLYLLMKKSDSKIRKLVKK